MQVYPASNNAAINKNTKPNKNESQSTVADTQNAPYRNEAFYTPQTCRHYWFMGRRRDRLDTPAWHVY